MTCGFAVDGAEAGDQRESPGRRSGVLDDSGQVVAEDDHPATVPAMADELDEDRNFGADLDNNGEVSVRERFSFVKRMWRTAPRSLRRSIVGVVGVTLLLLGALLVVLPGPFTLPLVIAGLAVLASEFAWAEQLLRKGRARASRLTEAARRFSRR